MKLKWPVSAAEWISISLAGSLILHGISMWLSGNQNQAFLDFSGAFGTVGLPSLVGSGYHIEVKKDLT